MTTAALDRETGQMARKAVTPPAKPIGPTLLKNLHRLGYADVVVRSTEIAKLVGEKTDKTLTRQRISAIMNAVSVEPETIALLAKAVGVKPSELTREA